MSITHSSLAPPWAERSRATLPVLVGAAIYAVFMFGGDHLLRDPDTYWQVALGNWILDQRAVPHVDPFSWTMRGAPWISTQWLAQVLFALSERAVGWGGPVVLAASAIATAYGLMTSYVGRWLLPGPTLLIAAVAFAISMPHLWARPHVLAMPMMVLFVSGLLTAMEQRRAPSLLLLPLMLLWANLHGGFVLGIASVAVFGIGATLASPSHDQAKMLLRWIGFGVLALAAACVTPYGWESILAARRILSLGKALDLIREWQPANFADLGPLEVVVIASFGLALWSGLKLSAIRTVMIVGLVYLALSHSRNAEVLALLGPLVLARPLADHLRTTNATSLSIPPTSVAAIVLLLCGGTAALLAARSYQPDLSASPVAAVRLLKERGITRVLNDYDFGGYLIAAGVAPYIDGRTELYGEARMVAHNSFSGLQKPADFFALIADERVEATLLRKQSAATTMLDHLDGWRRIYSDDIAVIHLRDAQATHALSPPLRTSLD